MVAIVCPHCQHHMGVQVRPDKVGGFRIRCTKCDERLWLLVPPQGRDLPIVAAKRRADDTVAPPYPMPIAPAKPPADEVLELELGDVDELDDLQLEGKDLDLDFDTVEDEDDDLTSLAAEIEAELEAGMADDMPDEPHAQDAADTDAIDTDQLAVEDDSPAPPAKAPSPRPAATPKPKPRPIVPSGDVIDLELDDSEDSDIIPLDDTHLPKLDPPKQTKASAPKPAPAPSKPTASAKPSAPARPAPSQPAAKPKAPAPRPTQQSKQPVEELVLGEEDGDRTVSLEVPQADDVEVTLASDSDDSEDDANRTAAGMGAIQVEGSKPAATAKAPAPPVRSQIREADLVDESPEDDAETTMASSGGDEDIELDTAAPAEAVDATMPGQAAAGDHTMPSGAGDSDNMTVVGTGAGSSAGAASSRPAINRPSRPPGAAPAAEMTAPSQGSASAASASAPAASAGGKLGRLGGYELVRELGRGGMGSVFLARQLSLDRDVAVKTMNEQWASNPAFVARFTREAYAAAQLVHHNVVQIYDIGEDRSTNFFSMEYVRGQSLGQLVRQSGAVDVEQAVGYILQAARGLRYAEKQGMIHRDIKPDNLMLNDQGIVKVADLGLVKTPGAVEAEIEAEIAAGGAQPAEAHRSAIGGASKLSSVSNVTRVDIAMGTPAYMAPEQARDAKNVDIRADIYSLGCTLYVLLTGKPVHEGKTAQELITKHATEPIVPPDVVSRHVPKELSAIIQRMVAKDPAQRYAGMDEVIKALEDFLGVDSVGPFTPSEEHVKQLEQLVQQYNNSPAAKLRKQLIVGFFGVASLVMVAMGIFQRPLLVGAMIGLMVLTAACYFVVTGITQKTFVFRKVRQLVFGSSFADWLIWTAGLTALLIVLYVFGQLLIWIGVAVAAAAIAIGFHVVFDRRARKQIKPILDQSEALLKAMRLRGSEEEALRQFICTYSGDRWEAYYEDLFDYEAKIHARQRWGKGIRGKDRKKYGPWRDALIAWIDERMKARKEARERKYLQKIQAKELKAKGMSEKEADAKAQSEANTMVSAAAAFQQTVAHSASLKPAAAGGTAVPGAAVAAAPTLKDLLKGDMDEAAEKRAKARAGGGKASLATLLFGRRMRFLLGIILVGICTLWLHQNNLIGEGSTTVWTPETASNIATGSDQLGPLDIPFVPDAVLAIFSGINMGVAGLILLASVFLGRVKISILVLPAAAVTMFAHHTGLIPTDLPIIGKHVEYAAIAGGLILAIPAFLLLRK